jgi:hypothetical protein
MPICIAGGESLVTSGTSPRYTVRTERDGIILGVVVVDLLRAGES